MTRCHDEPPKKSSLPLMAGPVLAPLKRLWGVIARGFRPLEADDLEDRGTTHGVPCLLEESCCSGEQRPRVVPPSLEDRAYGQVVEAVALSGKVTDVFVQREPYFTMLND